MHQDHARQHGRRCAETNIEGRCGEINKKLVEARCAKRRKQETVQDRPAKCTATVQESMCGDVPRDDMGLNESRQVDTIKSLDKDQPREVTGEADAPRQEKLTLIRDPQRLNVPRGSNRR